LCECSIVIVCDTPNWGAWEGAHCVCHLYKLVNIDI
jgi:hypothetical protein